jgi:hypothetical protein
MYAQNDTAAPSSGPSADRATLRTRPRVQRTFIRSWEYIEPVRVTILAIRMLVVLGLLFSAGVLVSTGHAWGWALIPAAVVLAAVSRWVFSTAAKGWPVAEA